MKHTYWKVQVMWLILANQSALFQHSIVMLLLNLLMTSAPGLKKITKKALKVPVSEKIVPSKEGFNIAKDQSSEKLIARSPFVPEKVPVQFPAPHPPQTAK